MMKWSDHIWELLIPHLTSKGILEDENIANQPFEMADRWPELESYNA